MWGATCADTFTPSSRSLAVHSPCAVVARTESLNKKYTDLVQTHEFTPIAVETSGVFGPQTLAFVRELGKRMKSHTVEERSMQYLVQRLSIAIQQAKATSILGALDSQRLL